MTFCVSHAFFLGYNVIIINSQAPVTSVDALERRFCQPDTFRRLIVPSTGNRLGALGGMSRGLQSECFILTFTSQICWLRRITLQVQDKYFEASIVRAP